MRSVTPQTLNMLQKHYGTEPILLVEIQWVENGQKILYSDQSIDGAKYPYPTIVEVSGFDTALVVKGASDSQAISIVLDDVDGSLQGVIDAHDIHMRPVWVYGLFKSLPLAHKFLLFKGEIKTPVIWDEGKRTLSFEVLTRIEDAEVAFSMEEGDFPQIPEDALGQVWPLVFGKVCNMQAVLVRSPRKGYLKHGEGIHDFTLEPRICQARYIQCPTQPLGTSTTISQGTDGGYETSEEQEYGPDLDCVARRFETICNLLYRQEQELEYEHSQLDIRDGEKFPQGEYVVLNINGAKFRGTFNGTYFTVMDREHPEYATWEHQPCVQPEDRSYGKIPTRWDGYWEESDSRTAWHRDREAPVETYDNCDDENVFRRGPTGGPVESWDLYNDMKSAGFFWIPAGTEVFLEAEAEVLYIVSLLPGTIDNVAAYRQMPSGRSLLMEVPSDLYTTYETDYGGYTVVEIGLEKRLSLYDSKWSDDLYISFTSTVGPNPVDIIEWLINKYTNLSTDSTSFADVKSKMTNYPCNFWVKERKNVLQLIQDIAYQTRCAVYIRNDVVYITYLSAEPTSVRTLDESDIVANSFAIKLSNTEDIITKHVINWQKTEAGIEDTDEVNYKIILKHNIPKYGVKEEDWKYYTQNTYSTILKSATFWLIRKAHTWKLIEFDTPLEHLDLDVFDCITIDVEELSSIPVKVVITNVQYNPDDNTMHFECWTPILAGTTTPYLWAWPANQSAIAIFPTVEEEQYAGAGYDFTVAPPEGHVLRSGWENPGDGIQLIMTAGDRYPSDLDDTLPTVTCEISDTYEIEEEEPEFEALELAQEANKRSMEANMNKDVPAAGTDSKKKKQRSACGMPQYGHGCLYEVGVEYVTVDLATSGKILGGCLGGPCGNYCGHPCTGTLSGFCHAFGAPWAAWMFYQQKKAEIDALFAQCGYCSGGTFPHSVRAPRAIADPDPIGSADECQEFPGSADDPNNSVEYEPKQSF